MIEIFPDQFTNLRDLLTAFASSMNLVSPETSFHHEQTAYLAYHIASAMNLPDEIKLLTIYTALLHDVGAISSEKPLTLDELEKDRFRIAKLGAEMLRDLEETKLLADSVEFSQSSWMTLQNHQKDLGEMCVVPSIVHLADAISAITEHETPVLNQVKKYISVAETMRGMEFQPEVVDAFLELTKYEFIWIDLVYNPEYLSWFTGEIENLTLLETIAMTKFMSRIIDFRSPFTAMHSAGVAASACSVAELMGMSENECKVMLIAGYLHDLGKLKVTKSILEKPGKLNDEEFNVIKEHPYHTRDILMKIKGFEQISEWAGYHHERIDGKGYPFHLKSEQLSLGSRILAVADVFSAIAEDRPYRKKMEKEKIIQILREDSEAGQLTEPVVECLICNYEYVDRSRDENSRIVGRHYYETFGDNS